MWDRLKMTGTHHSTLHTMQLLCIWLGLFLMRCTAQQTWCPGDSTIRGYDALVDVQSDMQMELDDIKEGRLPQSTYIFTLCPNMVYDISTFILTPVLSGAIFVCGDKGDPKDRCVVFGGEEQIRIIDSSLPDYPLESVSFIGITFTGFTGVSVAAKSSRKTTVTFSDCQWKEFASNFVIRQSMTETGESTNININGGKIQHGNTGSVLSNDGGNLILSDVEVRGVAASGISFLQRALIHESEIMKITFTTNSATQYITDSDITKMNKMSETFSAEDGATLFVSETSIRDNNITSEWIGVKVDLGKGTIQKSSFVRNNGVQYAFAATIDSLLRLEEVEIESNVGRSPKESAVIVGITDSVVQVSQLILSNNMDFSAQAMVAIRSTLDMEYVCLTGGESLYVFFIGDDSFSKIDRAFIDDDVRSTNCRNANQRLFKEGVLSKCFQGIDCNGICEDLISEDSCLASLTVPLSSTRSPRPPKGPRENPSPDKPVTPTLSPIAHYSKSSKSRAAGVKSSSTSEDSKKKSKGIKSDSRDNKKATSVDDESETKGKNGGVKGNSQKSTSKKSSKRKKARRFRKGLLSHQDSTTSIEDLRATVESELHSRNTSMRESDLSGTEIELVDDYY